MSYMQLFEVVNKPWASIKEIELIANCGRDSAIKIRNEIEDRIIKSGRNLPKSKTILVPMKDVLEYFNLDLKFIIEMVKYNQQLNRTENYAGISK